MCVLRSSGSAATRSVSPAFSETFAHARLVDALARLRNVFLQRRFEHRELLEHGGEERVVLLPVELPDILAV